MWSRKLGAALGVVALAGGLAAIGPADIPADPAGDALKAGDAAQAEQLATETIENASAPALDRARALLTRGLARDRLGDHDDALVDYTESLWLKALPPDQTARAYFDRGVSLEALGRVHDAWGDYTAAIHTVPGFAAAYNNRANLYRRNKQWALAARDYRAALAANDPARQYVFYGLAQIAQAQGKPELARRLYRRALADDPQYQDAFLALAALTATERATRSARVMAAAPRPMPIPALANASYETVAPDPIVLPVEEAAAPAPAPAAPAVMQADAAPQMDTVPEPKPRPQPPASAPVPRRVVASTPVAPPPAARPQVAPPMSRPDLRATLDGNDGAPQPQQVSQVVASVAPPAVQPQPQAAIASQPVSGPQIQLGSWRDEAQAAQGWNRIVGALGEALRNLTPHIVAADLPGKGRYFRLRAGPLEAGEADRLCGELKSKGYACMPVNG